MAGAFDAVETVLEVLSSSSSSSSCGAHADVLDRVLTVSIGSETRAAPPIAAHRCPYESTAIRSAPSVCWPLRMTIRKHSPMAAEPATRRPAYESDARLLEVPVCRVPHRRKIKSLRNSLVSIIRRQPRRPHSKSGQEVQPRTNIADRKATVYDRTARRITQRGAARHRRWWIVRSLDAFFGAGVRWRRAWRARRYAPTSNRWSTSSRDRALAAAKPRSRSRTLVVATRVHRRSRPGHMLCIARMRWRGPSAARRHPLVNVHRIGVHFVASLPRSTRLRATRGAAKARRAEERPND